MRRRECSVLVVVSQSEDPAVPSLEQLARLEVSIDSKQPAVSVLD